MSVPQVIKACLLLYAALKDISKVVDRFVWNESLLISKILQGAKRVRSSESYNNRDGKNTVVSDTGKFEGRMHSSAIFGLQWSYSRLGMQHIVVGMVNIARPRVILCNLRISTVET